MTALTPAQLKLLEHVVVMNDKYHLGGRARGAAWRAEISLVKLGFVEKSGDHLHITPAGREVLVAHLKGGA